MKNHTNLSKALETAAKQHPWIEELTDEQKAVILELMEDAHLAGYHEGHEDGEERGYSKGINDGRDEIDYCNCD